MQVFFAELMEYAVVSTFQQGEKAFGGVRERLRFACDGRIPSGGAALCGGCGNLDQIATLKLLCQVHSSVRFFL